MESIEYSKPFTCNNMVYTFLNQESLETGYYHVTLIDLHTFQKAAFSFQVDDVDNLPDNLEKLTKISSGLFSLFGSSTREKIVLERSTLNFYTSDFYIDYVAALVDFLDNGLLSSDDAVEILLGLPDFPKEEKKLSHFKNFSDPVKDLRSALTEIFAVGLPITLYTSEDTKSSLYYLLRWAGISDFESSLKLYRKIVKEQITPEEILLALSKVHPLILTQLGIFYKADLVRKEIKELEKLKVEDSEEKKKVEFKISDLNYQLTVLNGTNIVKILSQSSYNNLEIISSIFNGVFNSIEFDYDYSYLKIWKDGFSFNQNTMAQFKNSFDTLIKALVPAVRLISDFMSSDKWDYKEYYALLSGKKEIPLKVYTEALFSIVIPKENIEKIEQMEKASSNYDNRLALVRLSSKLLFARAVEDGLEDFSEETLYTIFGIDNI